MGNINSLSDAASYLYTEIQNELIVHGHFENPETQRLAKIIADVFSAFNKEVNGYSQED